MTESADPTQATPTTSPSVLPTSRRKWDTFVLGVQAGEFDHFVERVAGFEK